MPVPRAALTRRPLLISALASLLLLFAHAPVQAQLEVGSRAPMFTAPAAIDGQPFEFSLEQALAKGPVVVYFYPKAFTSGCTIEARLFAEAMDDFEAAGATVVGVSRDDLDTLKRFSEGPCAGRFAVAADEDGAIVKAYQAGFAMMPSVANRISYALAPDATVLESFKSMSPDQHVERTLQAIQTWQAQAQPAARP
jgi:peroxiredoxin Q/BCP